ncbi:MAG: TRAP transporter large permease subunit [Lentisphaeraceae bacterium]|nr:TRAP transporter large permease subunit [Lentisphaeraceae bacterium]
MGPEIFMLISMFVLLLVFIFSGIPIAFSLAGCSFAVTLLCVASNSFFGTDFYPDFKILGLVVNRFYGMMSNNLLVALPMFIFMGIMLDKSGLAERLMESFQKVFRSVRGGLALAVTLIGLLLAASTGIVGASVVLLTVMSLPSMLKNNYTKELSCGTVCAAGCLCILIPPSIMLIIIADQLNISVGDLFNGAVIPGLILTGLYCIYIYFAAQKPSDEERPPLNVQDIKDIFLAIIPPLLLILLVLGTIFFGIATPTEASGLGAFGAFLLAAYNRKLTKDTLRETVLETGKTAAFILTILLGAAAFSLTLKELGGDDMIRLGIANLPFSDEGIIIAILVLVFFLGFILDWIEISLILLPIVGPLISNLPIVTADGVDKPILVWFAILVAVTLQTSFLTPPVGFALFYLKGVAPDEIQLSHIYRGVVPFIIIQLIVLTLLFFYPQQVLWLPSIASR